MSTCWRIDLCFPTLSDTYTNYIQCFLHKGIRLSSKKSKGISTVFPEGNRTTTTVRPHDKRFSGVPWRKFREGGRRYILHRISLLLSIFERWRHHNQGWEDRSNLQTHGAHWIQQPNICGNSPTMVVLSPLSRNGKTCRVNFGGRRQTAVQREHAGGQRGRFPVAFERRKAAFVCPLHGGHRPSVPV